jgi:NAD(P)H-dependent FMN reductase
MQSKKNILFIICAMATMFFPGCNGTKNQKSEVKQDLHASSKSIQDQSKKLSLQIILGSTRQGRMSEKVCSQLKSVIDSCANVVAEVVDLRDYHLPFLEEAGFPSEREEITDPLIKRWSDKVKQGDAFIIIVPVYNGGYPGILKNALDLLFKEWKDKPVAFIGYSGGSSGGAQVISQLQEVAKNLQMKPIASSIKIPFIYKAFDKNGQLIDKNFQHDVIAIVNNLNSKP